MRLPTPHNHEAPGFILDDIELGHRAACWIGLETRDGHGAWIPPTIYHPDAARIWRQTPLDQPEQTIPGLTFDRHIT